MPVQLRNPGVAPIVATKFYRSNAHIGIDYEELEQEAYGALYRAETSPLYDPRKASLATFSNWCVSNELCTVLERHKRRHPVNESLTPRPGERGIEEWMSDGQPTPEDTVIFLEMLRQLPEDARIVVQVVLGDPGKFGGIASRACKQMIGEALGWSSGRLRRAFKSIESMLDPVEA